LILTKPLVVMCGHVSINGVQEYIGPRFRID
jgi:hypothetical protein